MTYKKIENIKRLITVTCCLGIGCYPFAIAAKTNSNEQILQDSYEKINLKLENSEHLDAMMKTKAKNSKLVAHDMKQIQEQQKEQEEIEKAKQEQEEKERQKAEEEAKKRAEEEAREKEKQDLIDSLGKTNLSSDVLKWALDVHEINEEIWDTQYDALVLAVIQVESGGKACDLMQSSESLGAGPAGYSCGAFENEKDSLKQGIKVLKNACRQAGVQSKDDYDHIAYALQGYNFGGKWFSAYSEYTKQNAKDFSNKMKAKTHSNVYGAPGYPEYVFKYYNSSYVFVDSKKDETSKDDVELPTIPEKPKDTNDSSSTDSKKDDSSKDNESNDNQDSNKDDKTSENGESNS